MAGEVLEKFAQLITTVLRLVALWLEQYQPESVPPICWREGECLIYMRTDALCNTELNHAGYMLLVACSPVAADLHYLPGLLGNLGPFSSLDQLPER